MDEKKIVLIAGATGRTGTLIVEELIKRNFKVRALLRPAASSSRIQQEGVEAAEADLTSVESLSRAMQGVHFLISAIGSKKPFSSKENNKVDNMGNQNLAKAAHTQGAQHIVVVSSIGVGESRNALGFLSRLVLGPVLKMKEKSEEFIRTCGVSYTIVRPGGLRDKEISGECAFGEGGKISGSVSRRQVAKVCVDALTNPAMKNRTLEVVDRSTVKPELVPFIISLK